MFPDISLPFDSAPGAEYLSPLEAAAFVVSTHRGSVHLLGGITKPVLSGLVDEAEFRSPTPRVLFVEAIASTSGEAIVEEIVSHAAAVALQIWPTWYEEAGVDFGICENDSLGHQAVGVLARKVQGAQSLWAEKAALAALRGKLPLVDCFSLRTQLEQLAKAISPTGLVLVTSLSLQESAGIAEAYVHALEWIAQSVGVVALCDVLPPDEPPFERILQYARVVRHVAASPEIRDTEPIRSWIAPWRGSPHPLSDIEKKMALFLAADAELGPLFAFNQTVRTERGTLPKVDLLWSEGRLVVELDGYESHGSRSSFALDRHRDYELMLSGYVVLRLPNDEIAQDCEKALEKIRDLVRLRRQTMTKEV